MGIGQLFLHEISQKIDTGTRIDISNIARHSWRGPQWRHNNTFFWKKREHYRNQSGTGGRR